MGRRSKDILLLVLAVIALVVALYTFRRKPQPVPSAKPAATAAVDEARPQGEKAREEKPASGKEQALAPVGSGGATRNPFEVPGEGPSAAAQSGRKPETSSEQAPAGKSQEMQAPFVFPLPSATKPPTVSAATGSKPGTSQMQLTLNGILSGPQSMAVIREGDKRYYVKVGDRVGDRYRVQAITQKEVVLTSSEGKVILRMGGRQ